MSYPEESIKHTNLTLNITFLPHDSTALMDQSLLYEVPRSHSDTPHSVGLLWTIDRPNEETCTGQHETFKRDRHPYLRLDSNLQSRQANDRKPTT